MDVEIPDEVRERLDLVGESIIWAISPDLVDGFSDVEVRVFKEYGPSFFRVLEGRQLPPGFSRHFKDDVLPDIEKVRRDAVARDAVRREIRAILDDPARMDQLYRPGGPTFSDILHKGANHVDTGMFRTPAHRAERAGRNRRR